MGDASSIHGGDWVALEVAGVIEYEVGWPAMSLVLWNDDLEPGAVG